jgi:DNA-binding MarR family transcriptional regulator
MHTLQQELCFLIFFSTICLTHANIWRTVSFMETQRWWDELERLTRILGQIGPDEVCCEGLTQRQCAILRTLVAQEGARLSDLAASSGITPSAMTRVLERLEIRGLVERVRGAHTDGRAAMVRVTPAGRRVRKQLDGLMRQRTETIIQSIPERQRDQVLKALALLNNAIEQAGCCALNAPVASLARIEEAK